MIQAKPVGDTLQITCRFKQLKHTPENSDLKMDHWKFGDSFFCSAKNEAHGRTTRKVTTHPEDIG